jgi:hypothetical protein
MAVHPLTYEYLSSRYTLTSVDPVCGRRAWYDARVHPLSRDPAESRRRWLKKRFPKRPDAGGCTCDHHRYTADGTHHKRAPQG